MSSTRLPIQLRRRALRQCLPHHQQRRNASLLFALSALSNSRETQHFNKATKLSRVEHSPALKLIQTSEVDPFDKDKRRGRTNVAGRNDVAEGQKKGEQELNADRIDNETAAELGQLVEKEYLARIHHVRQGVQAGVCESAWTAGAIESKSRPSEDVGEHTPSEISLGLALFGVAGLGFLLWELVTYRSKPDESGWRDVAAKKDEELRSLKGREAELHAQIQRARNAEMAAITARDDRRRALEEEMRVKQAKARDELRNQRLEKEKQLAALRKERDQLSEQARANTVKMADWTRKAEQLKQAVEKRDVSGLTKAEQNAYIEALVFLKVRQKPEKRWWKGLFWSQD